MKPMTDLCWTYQQNSSAILKAANYPERQKSSVVEEAQEHLRIVQCERSFYKTTCDDCKRSIKEFFTSANDNFQPPPLASQTPANSRDIRAHYSFDYAQQVHFQTRTSLIINYVKFFINYSESFLLLDKQWSGVESGQWDSKSQESGYVRIR